MQTLFEIKSNLPFDASIFERMKKSAADLLQATQKDKYTQAVVLYSKKRNEYRALLCYAVSNEKNNEAALLEALWAAKDTELRYVLCMWSDGGIDIPSYALREMLCTIDPRNADSLCFVMTKDGVGALKVSATMK